MPSAVYVPPPHLYPFQSRYADVNGHRMHYVDEGQGSPVVMLHGNPTWSFYYRELIKALRGRYRAVAPDHIGCGLSDKPDERSYTYTLRQRVADLEAFLAGLKLSEPMTLVLHDWGGMIGMAYAVRHPEQISRLVLLNTAAFRLRPGGRLPLALSLVRTPLGALTVRGMNVFSRSAAVIACKKKKLSSEERRAYTAPYRGWANSLATLRFVQDIPTRPEHPADAVLTETAAGLPLFRDRPVLICWGELDFVLDPGVRAVWEDLFPHAEVHRFADSGHYVLEDAGPAIIPLVQRFLASSGELGKADDAAR